MADKNPKTPLIVMVGSGPGGAAGITCEGAEWLSRADTVIYDRLAAPELLSLCSEDAELIYVGKESAGQSADQERINRLLIKAAEDGKIIVRLKGGDPMLFARVGEEIRALRCAGIPLRIVPGVSAAFAAAAFAGIPLTDRKLASSVAFVTGREDPDKVCSSINFQALAGIDTVVFYMSVGNLGEVASRLIAAGRDGDTPVAVVEQAASPRQRTITAHLSDIADKASQAAIKPPAVIIVGNVVSMRQSFKWYEDLPLFGKTVLTTTNRGKAMLRKLSQSGAEVIQAATITIEGLQDFKSFDSALKRLGEFDWLVLTSPNGADALTSRMKTLAMDGRAFGKLKIAAVGKTTAERLEKNFINADLVPDTFTTEALARAIVAQGIDGKRILLARSDIARNAMGRTLTDAGAAVEEITVYRTAKPSLLPDAALLALREARVNWITFTSPSTVENFFALISDVDLASLKFAAIGPVTAAALEARGFKPTVTAEPHTAEALADAIIESETS